MTSSMMKKLSKKLNTAYAFVIGLAIMLFVFMGILFPTFVYQLYVPDSHGIALWQKQIGEKNFLHISPFFSYQFSSIKLRIQSDKDFVDSVGPLKVFKGYISQAFEAGEAITTREQLEEILTKNNSSAISNGRLVSKNDTVYFVSDGQARAILAPEIFLQMGFKWESVEKIDDDAFGSLGQGEEINFGSLHPNQTLFVHNEEYFFVDDEKKRKVNSELVGIIPDSVKPVELSSEELEQIGTCALLKIRGKKTSCSFEPTETITIAGNDYVFELPEWLFEHVEKGDVTLRTMGGLRKDIARSSLVRIKTSLANRYFPDILR